MKRTNSFVLFGRAFKNAKNDFWVSIQVLFVATVILQREFASRFISTTCVLNSRKMSTWIL